MRYNLTRRATLKALAGSVVSTTSAMYGWAETQPPGKRQKSDKGKNALWLTLPATPTLPTPIRAGLAKINGISIYYAQFGHAGPPVLLLHGGLANSNYWGHQLPDLTRHFTVTVTDTRGHGRSPLGSRSFGFRLFAEDAIALLDFLEIERASVVGWSDGAITALQLAMTKPERVSKLVAFGANSSLAGLKPGGSKSAVFVSYSERCRAEYKLLSPRPERWQELLSGLRVMWRTEPNFSAKDLAAVRVPTLISAGEHDEIIKRDDTERMARTIPGAHLAIQRGVSHFAMLQNPTQFNNVMMEFFTKQH